MGTEILSIENGNASVGTFYGPDKKPRRKETEMTPAGKHIATANIFYTYKLHSNCIPNHSYFITSEKYLHTKSAQTG